MKLNNNQKGLIIGDIHGCYHEMMELIKKSGIEIGKDYIISLGDIVDRGPAANQVISFFQNTANSYVILGNHEIKHIRRSRADLDDPSASIQRLMLSDLENQNLINFIKQLPLFLTIETENKKYLLLHAGINNLVDIENMPAYIDDFESLTENIRIISGIGSQNRKGFDQKSIPWYNEINLDYTIVFGHLISNEVIRGSSNNVFGIDTGCFEGGRLTGLILPDESIVEINSAKNYYHEISQQYLDQHYLQNYGYISWDKKLALLGNELLPELNKKITSELSFLKEITLKINFIAEKILSILDLKDNNDKEKLGKNWNKFLLNYPNLSSELKKALFKSYEEHYLFGLQKDSLMLLEQEISLFLSNIEIEMSELLNIWEAL